MNTVYALNIPDAYDEVKYKLKSVGVAETSRNGPVISAQGPVYLDVIHPMQRVLTDPLRDANPFFHVMEFVWMMAGENNVKWIEQFNKRFRDFADPGTDTIHASYGHRWLKHFGKNQIAVVSAMLRDDRTTRRAVIGMWDPRSDLSHHNDLPCNTQIMFRFNHEREALDMLVTNRSNDLFWGMLGANAVHMTYMFELVCHEAELKMGHYRVFTNNLHAYTNMPKFQEIWNQQPFTSPDVYSTGKVKPYPLMEPGEHQSDLVWDCMTLMSGEVFVPMTMWMHSVARPIHDLWFNRDMDPNGIAAGDWRIACREWLERRKQRTDV